MAIDTPLDGYALLQQYRAQELADAARRQAMGIQANQEGRAGALFPLQMQHGGLQNQGLANQNALFPLQSQKANLDIQKELEGLRRAQQQRGALSALTNQGGMPDPGKVAQVLLAGGDTTGAAHFLNLARQSGSTVPAGYRKTATGLEPIPGGPADTKIQGQLNQDTAMLGESMNSMDRLAAEANRLKEHPGLDKATGLMSAVPLAGGFLTVPGTDAANFKSGLGTLKSQVAFGTLQNMRNNSKTGGALGQVSNIEEKMLMDNLASLDTAQSPEEYRKRLDTIINYTSEAKDRLRGAYNIKHGSKGQSSTSEKYEVGKTYTDAQGNKATYLGMGKWKQ